MHPEASSALIHCASAKNPFFSIEKELVVLVDLLRENTEVVNNSVCFLFINSLSRRSTNHFPPISHSGRPHGISEACDFTPDSTPGYVRDSHKAVIITTALFKTCAKTVTYKEFSTVFVDF